MNEIKKYQFSSRVWRVFLVGPLVFLTAIAMMAGAAVWYPPGPAKIDNIVLPLVMFPLVWALLFFYSCLDSQLKRAYVLVLIVLIVNLLLVVFQLMQGAE